MNYDDVVAFHRKFGVPIREMPQLLSLDEMEYRTKFLREELWEFNKAWNQGNLVGAVDGLLDLVYVALGTAAMMGVPWQKCWEHVQAANMAKQRANPDLSDSPRKHALDVVKPAGWKAPDVGIMLELQKAGWLTPTGLMIDNATGKVEVL